MMRLSRFIRDNREQILSEWEAFARTLVPAAEAMNMDELRDHAEGILTAIEADLEQPQSKRQQAEKSKGHSDPEHAEPTDAKAHGAVRAGTGFTLPQMVSEFRALRASVLRLWAEKVGETGNIAEITRFNEAIDEALAESSQRFNEDLDHSKDLFLGVLGKDLRDPLGAITTSAHQMLRQVELEGPQGKTATRILNNSLRMQEIIGDLLDFIRTRLGAQIVITRAQVDLKEVMASVKGSLPQTAVNVQLGTHLEGDWDAARLGQALTNVIGSLARQQPDKTAPITLTARGEPDEVVLTINGRGTIPEEDLGQVFAPVDLTGAEPAGSRLGLGLYLAQEILVSHRGKITVDSTEEDGTTYTIRLPRQAHPKPLDS